MPVWPQNHGLRCWLSAASLHASPTTQQRRCVFLKPSSPLLQTGTSPGSGDAEAATAPAPAAHAATLDREVRLVAQLQELAREQRGHRKSVQGAGDHDKVDADVGSDVDSHAPPPLAAECTAGSAISADGAGSRTAAAAWMRALALVDAEPPCRSSTTPVTMEWLLFLCLRSRGSTETPAPHDVVEGVYRAWRSLQHRGSSDVNADADAAAPTASSLRSPFSPKGVQHHYAAALLGEFNRVRGDGSAGDEHQAPSTAPRCGAVQHGARFLLNRALEVLLLDLPQDAADAAEAEHVGQSPHDARRTHILRPSTALLVLEAVRHAALLHVEAAAADTGATQRQDLPFQTWLLSSPSASTLPRTLSGSHLAAVARAAFEDVMQQQQQRDPQYSTHSDAITLYLSCLAVLDVDADAFDEQRRSTATAFALAGSLTARQLSAAQGSPDSHAGLLGEEDFTGASSRLAMTAAVRALLGTYLSSAHPSSGEPARRTWQRTQDAVIAALCRPSSLQSFSATPSLPPVHLHGGGGSQRVQRRPLPWCVWMLRLLLAEDKAEERVAELRLSSAQTSTTLSLVAAFMAEIQRHAYADFAAREGPSQGRHRRGRHELARVRPPLQLMWAELLTAAVHGQLLESEVGCSAADSSATTLRGGPTAPAVLRCLCYPYYDKTQWRGPSVNRYIRLLDQWGQSAQLRQVVGTVARREHGLQQAVQAAVVKELRTSSSTGAQDAAGAPVAAEARDAAVAPIFRRYHPALTLESCCTALRHCGCSREALAELLDGATLHMHVTDRRDAKSTAVSAAQAKLAGAVLQYMICALHVAERRTGMQDAGVPWLTAIADSQHAAVPECDDGVEDRDDSEAPQSDPSVGSSFADGEAVLEGLPISRWVSWVRASCVPAVEALYEGAGLEEEWGQLGFGTR